MKTETLVVVDAAKKIGVVKVIAADGMIGVALMDERGRVDYWHPTQVKEVTAKEAAEYYLKN